MQVLKIARDLDLSQWMIGAGFVRNKIWSYLSGDVKEGVDTFDVDLVYFDKNRKDEKEDEELSKQLKIKTGINYEIVNEICAHAWNDLPPYLSTKDAISKWPETVTAIGIFLDKNNKLQLFAPHGIDDLINFIVRPTPAFVDEIEKIKVRVEKKGWIKKWPKIQIVN